MGNRNSTLLKFTVMKKNNYKFRWQALFLIVSITLFSYSARTAIYPFTATYSGANEVPPNASPGTGTITGVYDDVSNMIFYTISFSGLMTGTTAAHFHSPGAPGVIAPVLIAHNGFPTNVMAGTYSNSHLITAAQETDLLAGLWYSNIHTTGLPAGEIRAQIILGAASTSIYTFNRTYSGANENPPNGSTATGTIIGAYNEASNTIFYTITFSGLSSPTTGAHFHAPALPFMNAPVVFPHGIPNGITSGNFSNFHVLNATQETSLLGGLWYSNIHSTLLPGGEIRAQIFFNAPFVAPVISCPQNITVSNAPGLCSQSVSFAATATGDPAPAITYRIGNTAITSPHVFPVGTTNVTADAINGGGYSSCTFMVTVNDTEGPVITNLVADPDMLWPPNHKMKDVQVSYNATDNCPGPIVCQLVVTSDEPVMGNGSGNTTPDWQVINTNNIKLRAERDGGGDGRIYTLTLTCRDQLNNSTTSTTSVEVPHDLSARGNAFEMENCFSESLIVRPIGNPSGRQMALAIETPNYKDRISLSIIDISGRIVESGYYNPGTQTLKVGNNLKAGLYFIVVKQANEIVRMKLIKSE